MKLYTEWNYISTWHRILLVHWFWSCYVNQLLLDSRSGEKMDMKSEETWDTVHDYKNKKVNMSKLQRKERAYLETKESGVVAISKENYDLKDKLNHILSDQEGYV